MSTALSRTHDTSSSTYADSPLWTLRYNLPLNLYPVTLHRWNHSDAWRTTCSTEPASPSCYTRNITPLLGILPAVPCLVLNQHHQAVTWLNLYSYSQRTCWLSATETLCEWILSLRYRSLQEWSIVVARDMYLSVLLILLRCYHLSCCTIRNVNK
jgi:hypothetical protein